ncbi:tetratricopeptide repeat-containing sensor histidine kinase [Haloflavibacter putidus]|uniref:histidine kinase n=1 Tax=Haloflavibacter putidus TaxID=2576776 RepID=A0A507ZYE8_9FLAO|nr:tetratricopeptide repeat protein [Haloflavibacter putidus]TQD38622.1 tetratricopeptide repeat protein [Haloflavibacter putidus]
MVIEAKFWVKFAVISFFLFQNLQIWCQAKDSSFYYVAKSTKLYKESPQKALVYLQKAEELLKQYPNDSLEAMTLKNYAAIYYVKGQYAKSFKFSEKALEKFRVIDDLYNISLAYNGLGLVQQALGRHGQAIDYFIQAQNVQPEEKAVFSLNLGISYFYLNDFENAKTHYLKAQENITDKANHIYINTLSRLAQLEYKAGNFWKAEKEYLAVLKDTNTTNWEKAFVSFGLAEVYLAQEKLDSAIEYASKAKELSASMQATWDLKRSTEILARAQRKKGNFVEAFENLDQYIQLKDSLFNKEQAEIVGLLQLNLKESENKLLQQKNELAQEQLHFKNIVIFFGVILFGTVLVFLYKYRKISKEREGLIAELSSKNDKLSAIDSNRNKLFSIVSHDVRSPIASMTQLMDEAILTNLSAEEREETFKLMRLQLNETSRMLNNLLVWANNQIKGKIEPQMKKIDVVQEMQAILKVYQIPINYKNIHLKHNIPVTPVTIKADVAQLHVVFHNLLSNALKYTSKNKATIVDYAVENNKVIIAISNEGSVITQETKKIILAKEQDFAVELAVNDESGFGLGFQLVRKYLAINNAEIKIEGIANYGTVVKLIFDQAE